MIHAFSPDVNGSFAALQGERYMSYYVNSLYDDNAQRIVSQLNGMMTQNTAGATSASGGSNNSVVKIGEGEEEESSFSAALALVMSSSGTSDSEDSSGLLSVSKIGSEDSTSSGNTTSDAFSEILGTYGSTNAASAVTQQEDDDEDQALSYLTTVTDDDEDSEDSYDSEDDEDDDDDESLTALEKKFSVLNERRPDQAEWKQVFNPPPATENDFSVLNSLGDGLMTAAKFAGAAMTFV